MAIQTQPGFIPAPFANSGTKNVIPETMPTPSASAAASWTDGFPTVCSLPLASGGIPPARADFNGIFNSITQAQAFYQSGGIYEWDATIDYDAQRIVRGSNGLLYRSMAQSGPNTGAGAVDPTADDGTYWGTPLIPTMPAGDNSQAAATTSFVGSAINIAVPVGTVLWSANPAVPSGYLPCNGAAVGTSDYPALFAAIGKTFTPQLTSTDPDVENPEYSDPTVFRLPNLMGKVPWGATSVGTVLDAGLPNITGTMSACGSIAWQDGKGAFYMSGESQRQSLGASGSNVYGTTAAFDASRANSIYGASTTVQPPALCLLPCIRYE